MKSLKNLQNFPEQQLINLGTVKPKKNNRCGHSCKIHETGINKKQLIGKRFEFKCITAFIT